jgi:hypothetical protein
MNDEERMKQLLKQAVRPLETDAAPAIDLWPSLLRRLNDDASAETVARTRWVWLDGALLAGLIALGVSFPSTIPLLLYYL